MENQYNWIMRMEEVAEVNEKLIKASTEFGKCDVTCPNYNPCEQPHLGCNTV
jgi:hypothetical protein